MRARRYVPISPALLGELEETVRADPAGGFMALWRHLEPEWDSLEVVDPRDYEVAWGVSQRLVDAAPDPVAFNLLWLNIGPSVRGSA